MQKLFLLTFLALMSVTFAFAQNGTKERIKVHSKALEGNLIGDQADRDVTVYLPPSYASNPLLGVICLLRVKFLLTLGGICNSTLLFLPICNWLLTIKTINSFRP